MIKKILTISFFVLAGAIISVAGKYDFSEDSQMPTQAEACHEPPAQEPVKENYKTNSSVTSHVTVTCYQPTVAQNGPNPLITADGSKIDLNKLNKGTIKWCAVSRDMERLFPMGSKIRLTDESTGECLGIYEVHDRMARRWSHRIDILVPTSHKKLFKANNVKAELVK